MITTVIYNVTTTTCKNFATVINGTNVGQKSR